MVRTVMVIEHLLSLRRAAAFYPRQRRGDGDPDAAGAGSTAGTILSATQINSEELRSLYSA
jgi:hypothetical protein